MIHVRQQSVFVVYISYIVPSTTWNTYNSDKCKLPSFPEVICILWIVYLELVSYGNYLRLHTLMSVMEQRMLWENHLCIMLSYRTYFLNGSVVFLICRRYWNFTKVSNRELNFLSLLLTNSSSTEQNSSMPDLQRKEMAHCLKY